MANIQYYDVILKPVVTEKSMELMGVSSSNTTNALDTSKFFRMLAKFFVLISSNLISFITSKAKKLAQST